MKKKIVQITARADSGGGPLILFSIVSELNKELFDCTIFSPFEEPYYSKFKKIGGVRTEVLNSKNFSPKNLFRFIRKIRRIKPEIIHCHGKGGGVWGRFAKLFLWKTKVLYHFHGIHFESYGILAQKFYFLFERIFSFLTLYVIHVSKSEEKLNFTLSLTPFSKPILIHNGVDLDKFFLKIDSEKTPSGIFQIITVARLAEKKNFELSFRILQKLKEKKLNFRFTLVGNEDELTLTEIQNLAERYGLADRVVLAGYQEKIVGFLVKSDCFFSTSKIEGLPTTFIEACACGLPIVATNVTGNDEFADLETIRLIDSEDIDGFCNAFFEFYQNRIDPKIPVEYAKQRFALLMMIKKHEELYLSL